jgi:hypothetical protein
MRCMRDDKSNTDGKNSQIYPALAQVSGELFGLCVVGTHGEVHYLSRRVSFYDSETDGFHKQKSCALEAIAAPRAITLAKKFMAMITFSV